MKTDSSYILHETAATVIVATGFKAKSHNAKTGAMVQIYILRKDRDPRIAVNDGSDKAICGECPLRRNPQTGKRACYVDVGRGPLSIWKAYTRGRYRHLTDYSVFRGRTVRFGAYGEPIKLPLEKVKAIVAETGPANWTGYTHQWRNPLLQGYRPYLMASCNPADYLQAQAMGWRTFTVVPKRVRLEHQVICPASKEAGHRVNCIDCRLCAGTSRNARSIQIEKH